MQSIYQQNNFIERLEKLHPSTKPLWGKMNASQMLAHCNISFKIGIGTLTPKSNFIGRLIGPLILKMLVSPKPFKKNVMTGKEFIINDTPDFEKTKAEFIQYIKDFSQKGTAAVTRPKHPFFGNMTFEEWDKLLVKHNEHHFSQFGI